jgi:hypothetical protein
MKVTDNPMSKRAEFYLSREEKGGTAGHQLSILSGHVFTFCSHASAVPGE